MENSRVSGNETYLSQFTLTSIDHLELIIVKYGL